MNLERLGQAACQSWTLSPVSGDGGISDADVDSTSLVYVYVSWKGAFSRGASSGGPLFLGAVLVVLMASVAWMDGRRWRLAGS